MADNTPMKIGVIDDGFFDPIDLYMITDQIDHNDIYEWRLANNLTSDPVLDEFYVMAPASFLYFKESTKSNTGTTTVNYKPFGLNDDPICLFHVYKQYVGDYIEIVKASELGIKKDYEHLRRGFYTLPPIPSRMVQDVDAFLHAVDAKYGTEGILLLTYDESYRGTENEADGWNYAIPDQENTSHHCNYDKGPIVESLPDSVNIVGTIHSHPGMTAYASQTDHDDQKGFDGLHITFGWLGTGQNLKREYYAELVCGNNFYQIDPDIVMDLTPQQGYVVNVKGEEILFAPEDVKVVNLTSVDKDVIDSYVAKVSKQTYTHSSTSWGGGTPKALSGGQTHNSLPSKQTLSSDDLDQDVTSFIPIEIPNQVLSFPEDFPDPTENFIFISVDMDITTCPCCNNSWKFTWDQTYIRRQCLYCGVFILFDDETPLDASIHRHSYGLESFQDVFDDSDLNIIVYNPNDFTWDVVGDSKKALT